MNKLTGEIYIGSSVDVKKRWREHKSPSHHKKQPNNRMYHDMDSLGVDSFDFEVIEEVSVEELRIKEDEYIKNLNPEYNILSAVLDVEKRKVSVKAYRKSEKWKAQQKSYQKAYRNLLCNYNGETLTLKALSLRFQRQGIPHPFAEARKFLIAS